MVSGLTTTGKNRRSSRQQITLADQSPSSPVQLPEEPTSTRKRKIPHRITVACTTCRNQHLRCDGAAPVCTRCREGNKRCVYKDIRRQSRRLRDQHDSTLGSDSGRSRNVNLSDNSWAMSESPGQELYSLNNSSNLVHDPFLIPQPVNPRQSKPLESFYTSFFKGHPFALPRTRLISQFDKDPASVTDLIKVIAFIGSLYMFDPSSQGYRAAVESAIAKGLPQDGFSVQCLLLFAGALEWSGEQDYAQSMLDKAKSMALNIGIQFRSYAQEHGQGCLVLEESWRRTWWELYIIDAIFAGTRHLPTFELWHVDYDAGLPCDEMVYIHGVSRDNCCECQRVD